MKNVEELRGLKKENLSQMDRRQYFKYKYHLI